MRRLLLILLAAVLAAVPLSGLCEGTEALRGYDKSLKYQYVQLGQYPYTESGEIRPVLWRVLDVRDGQMLLLTEYVIDTSQIIFETDQKIIENHSYRRINTFAESDLMPELNTTYMDRLFGDDPIRNAMIPEGENGKLFILSKEQFMNTDYGFPHIEGFVQPTRQAKGTPYAVAQRNLYVEGSNGKSTYWVSTVRGADGYKMFLVGYDGHISAGAYTRVNVGLRLSVRLDLSMISVTSGRGTMDDPFTIAYSGPEPLEAVMEAEVPPAEPAAEADQLEIIEISGMPAATTAEEESQAAETPVPEGAEQPEQKADGEVTISLLGDCSIGDTIGNIGNAASYHSAVDKNGYGWPFSLVSDYLKNDDLTVANLEAVLTSLTRHSSKKYNLKAEPDHVNILTEGGIEMVNTVNNHCMDFYNDGYEESLSILDAAGIGHFGLVTSNHVTYDDLGVADLSGIRVGFLGISYPQDTDQKKIAARIRTLKEEKGCDVVIVSLHWGRETYMTPSSWQMPYAKKVIDAGADAVYGHHPHVIQPIQFYKGKPILYSTGNFTFGTISKLDPSTGIFQLTYARNEAGEAELRRLRVIPCNTQGSPDYRPIEVTDPEARQAIFKKLMLKKNYANCENPPDSFLETGIVEFSGGKIIR